MLEDQALGNFRQLFPAGQVELVALSNLSELCLYFLVLPGKQRSQLLVVAGQMLQEPRVFLFQCREQLVAITVPTNR